ncbi:putative Ig domain-containing protein [Lapillicoccus sp.]|uniref:putative Ig domain-containing protein n=1 Tax=Lapillicoccus sp. TaxID=1909287 RepID=UPI003982E336
MITPRLVRGVNLTRTVWWLVLTTVVLTFVPAEPAVAVATVTRAEVSGTQLRLQGTALPLRDVTVDGVVLGRSDGSGAFRIQRDPFQPPSDCSVDVNDGSATVTVVRLSGCTVTPSPPTPGDIVAPTVPANLTASLAGTTANLGWTTSTDAVGVAGYRVSRNGAVLSGTVAGTTFADSGLTAGTYGYTVTAVDAAGNVSGASNSASVTVASAPPPPADTTAPTVPANLTAVLSGTTANLSWTASTDNIAVTGYKITRNGVFHTDALNTFYNGTGLAVGTYTYTVAAVDGAGNVSGSSNSASVTVPPPPPTDTSAPTVPANLTTTVVGTTISLGWAISADDTAVTGYRVTRNGAVLGTTIDTTFLNSGLAPGTYTYTVMAFDGAGNISAASSGVSATVAAPAPLGFVTPSRLPDATVGQAYLGYIVSSDPPGPSTFRFKLVSGKVPAATSFVGNSLPNRPEARVVGTPTAVGTSTFTVEVSDGAGATARRTFTISVLAAPALAIAGGVNVLSAGTVGQPYGDVLSATGGVTSYTWAITGGTLPPGLSLVGSAFFGTPTTAGTHLFTARVTDGLGATASGQFSIAVGP